jgi:hypothetical protein
MSDYLNRAEQCARAAQRDAAIAIAFAAISTAAWITFILIAIL